MEACANARSGRLLHQKERRSGHFGWATRPHGSPGDGAGMKEEFRCIAADVKLGKGVFLAKFINLYGCSIGEQSKIGAFVEIQKNSAVGKNCKIWSHRFVGEGGAIEDNDFVGHGVTFINDAYPRATNGEGELQ